MYWLCPVYPTPGHWLSPFYFTHLSLQMRPLTPTVRRPVWAYHLGGVRVNSLRNIQPLPSTRRGQNFRNNHADKPIVWAIWARTEFKLWEVNVDVKRELQFRYSFRTTEFNFIILHTASSLLEFSSKLIHLISNYAIEIQFVKAITHVKQYKFKLCDPNSVLNALFKLSNSK